METVTFRTALMEKMFRHYSKMEPEHYRWAARLDIGRFADGDTSEDLFEYLPNVGEEFYKELYERLEEHFSE